MRRRRSYGSSYYNAPPNRQMYNLTYRHGDNCLIIKYDDDDDVDICVRYDRRNKTYYRKN